MKKLLLFFIIFYSCAEEPKKENSFNLSGKIDGNYSDYIYLNYGEIKDSVIVENNSFEFNGEVEKPIQGWLNLKPYANAAFIYIENSNISIQADFEIKNQNEKELNVLTINDIKGSYSAKIQQEYKDFYQANQNKDNFKDLLLQKLESFVQTNKNHPFSGTVLGEIALLNPILTKEELLELYSKIDTVQQNKDDLKLFRMGIANLERNIWNDIYKKLK